MTADAQILTILRTDAVDGIAAGDLARRTGLSESALHTRIEDLRALGYDIAKTPHQGYQLRSSPDALHADDLFSRLRHTRVIGRDVRVFQETTSTNDIVEKLARDGVREGVAVFAEAQTKGRGRMGRTWISPAGQGLWFSVLLRPNITPQATTQLTVISATATARAIREETGLPVQIKWPNDILVNGRKVVGILTEMSAEGDAVRHVTLGIGVDVNIREFPSFLRDVATSLAIERGAKVDRPALAAAILRHLDHDYARICSGDFAGVAEEWEEQCITLGRRVRIHVGERVITGRAEALDRSGALLIRSDHGHQERILGGDVILEKDPS